MAVSDPSLDICFTNTLSRVIFCILEFELNRVDTVDLDFDLFEVNDLQFMAKELMNLVRTSASRTQ